MATKTRTRRTTKTNTVESSDFRDNTKVVRTMARQGDVLVFRAPKNVEKGPEVTDPNHPGKTVLALGEVTGHHHRFEGAGAELFACLSDTPMADADDKVLRTDGSKGLKHEEHGTILFDAGDFVVRIQEEYAYGASRRVAD